MNEELSAHARMVAEAVLGRFGNRGARWRVVHVGDAPNADPPVADLDLYSGPPKWTPPTDDGEGHQIAVVINMEPDYDGDVTCYYGHTAPASWAIAELASQIQDFAVEAAWAQALPPCPGHPHPLSPTVIDDVAVWHCPRDPCHHAEPIVRDLDTRKGHADVDLSGSEDVEIADYH